MLIVEVKVEGPALSGKVNPRRDIIQPATDRVIETGLRIARDLTPVATGRAQDGWYTERGGEVQFIVNEVPYIRYLEEGTRYIRPYRMGEQAAAAMGKLYGSELSVQVDRVLG